MLSCLSIAASMRYLPTIALSMLAVKIRPESVSTQYIFPKKNTHRPVALVLQQPPGGKADSFRLSNDVSVVREHFRAVSIDSAESQVQRVLRLQGTPQSVVPPDTCWGSRDVVDEYLLLGR